MRADECGHRLALIEVQTGELGRIRCLAPRVVEAGPEPKDLLDGATFEPIGVFT